MGELRLPHSPLSDGVITLRAFTLDDVAWVVEGCSDPGVARFTGVPAPYTEAHAHDWIGGHADERGRGQAIHLAIAEKAGATREGVLRSYVVARGTRHDCVMYSLLPDDPSPGGGAP